jgi:hypothetical protein
MRIRRIVAGIAVVVAALATLTATASARDVGITANCGGYTVVRAAYVRHVFSNTALGSIQLCYNGNNASYFARLEMYSNIPSNHIANAYLDYRDFFGNPARVTCADHADGYLLPGSRRVCYTPYVQGIGWYSASGRFYRWNGSSWVLEGYGYVEL